MANGIFLSEDTKKALEAAVGASGGIRSWARAHAISPGVVSDILAGHDEDVSVRMENRVRAALGLPPIPPRRYATCCPDCLARGVEVVHGDGLRCYGKRNGQAVVIGEDEKVIRRRAAARRPRGPRLEVRGLSPATEAWWRALSPTARAQILEKIGG